MPELLPSSDQTHCVQHRSDQNVVIFDSWLCEIDFLVLVLSLGKQRPLQQCGLRWAEAGGT